MFRVTDVVCAWFTNLVEGEEYACTIPEDRNSVTSSPPSFCSDCHRTGNTDGPPSVACGRSPCHDVPSPAQHSSRPEGGLDGFPRSQVEQGSRSRRLRPVFRQLCSCTERFRLRPLSA